MSDMKKQLCPRRQESVFGDVFKVPEQDDWREDGTCSWCGSMKPETFMQLAEAGELLTPTDKSYKVYVDHTKKFYFQHLDTEQKKHFVYLLNARKLKIDFPGHFYVLPFFIRDDEV